MASVDRAAHVAIAARAFERRFGHRPAFAAAAPGRVNLIGGHTDYNEGAVLPMAIDRETVAVGARAEHGASTVVALDLEASATLGLAAEPSPQTPRWAATLGAVARELASLGRDVPEVEVALTGTVPVGAGLSSSAAMAVAFATLLDGVTGTALDPLDKALLCQRAEHVASGVPCGIMDMLVATSARAQCAMLIDCRSHALTPIPLPALQILVVDTGVRHDLADTAYAERRATCERAAAKLGLPALRDATPTSVERTLLSPVERRRAAHVVAEHDRTLRAARLLERGDLTTLGGLLFESHDSLRDLYEVSCPELDTVVRTARHRCASPGDVHGARMTGAGFGGCAIVLLAPDAGDDVADAIVRDFQTTHHRAPTLFTVRAAGAAQSLDLRNIL